MKKQKRFQILLCIIMAICLLSACTVTNRQSGDTNQNSDASAYEQLSGKRIGVLAASHIEDTIRELIPSATIEYGNSFDDLAYALEAGTIDAYVSDQPIARKMVEKYSKQQIVALVTQEGYGYIYPKNSEKSDLIRTQMDSFLQKIKADNTLQEIDSIWFGSDESLKVIDETGITGTNGELTMAVASAIGEPFSYIKDEKYVGYDIDIAMRFCKEYGYSLKIVDVDPGNIINLVAKG